MASSLQFIPAGRTSTVKRGNTVLQVQTEYAHRPNPRITTTILDNGRVLHKIERGLDQAISSIEEQQKTETTLVKQHAEVIAIIQGKESAALRPAAAASTVAVAEPPLSTYERIKAIPGVQYLLQLENDGTITTPDEAEPVLQQFGKVLKHLHELLEIFDRVPGVGVQRKSGVYEIERDRLYLASAGSECYFLVVRRVNVTTQYEQELKAIIRDV